MYVHRAGIAEVVEAPDLVQKLVAGEYPVGEAGQVVQQFQFFGRRVHLLPVYDQFVGIQIDDQLVVGQLAPLSGLVAAVGAAQHRVDPGSKGLVM